MYFVDKSVCAPHLQQSHKERLETTLKLANKKDRYKTCKKNKAGGDK